MSSNNPFASLFEGASQSLLDAAATASDNFTQNSLLERVFLITLDSNYANKSVPVVFMGDESRDESFLTINNIDEVL
jgi:hypothetical protein